MVYLTNCLGEICQTFEKIAVQNKKYKKKFMQEHA